MENLLYLTLELSDGRYIEQIVLADKKDEAAKSIVADNKWRNPNQAFPDIKLDDQLKMLQDKFR